MNMTPVSEPIFYNSVPLKILDKYVTPEMSGDHNEKMVESFANYLADLVVIFPLDYFLDGDRELFGDDL